MMLITLIEELVVLEGNRIEAEKILKYLLNKEDTYDSLSSKVNDYIIKRKQDLIDKKKEKIERILNSYGYSTAECLLEGQSEHLVKDKAYKVIYAENWTPYGISYVVSEKYEVIPVINKYLKHDKTGNLRVSLQKLVVEDILSMKLTPMEFKEQTIAINEIVPEQILLSLSEGDEAE